MRRTLITLLAVCGSAQFASADAQAQSVAACQAVLTPTIEQSNSDYVRMQSYMYTNSEYEFDRLKKMSNESRSADAGFKAFSAEYEDSNTREEFSERVRRRMRAEGFTLNESEAKSYARIGLTDKQVDGWMSCVSNVSGAGGILLTPRGISGNTFNLRIARVFQSGVGSGRLELGVSNGTINGVKQFTEQYVGSGAKTYEVIADSPQSKVSIRTNLASLTDDLVVDLNSSTQKTPLRSKVFVSGVVELAGGVKEPISRREITPNFQLPTTRRLSNFTLTIEQEVNGRKCASAVIEMGALNWPTGTTMNSQRQFRPQIQAGCQVPASYMQIQCFVDEKEPQTC